MKQALLFIVLFGTISSCNGPEEPVKPEIHSGAKPFPALPGIEDWGGITLQPVPHYVGPGQPPTMTYEALWANNIPIRLTNMSYELVPGYGVAWGQLANESELNDMSVLANGGIGSEGTFRFNQLYVDGDYGDPSYNQAVSDAENELAGITWWDDTDQENKTLKPGLRALIVDAIRDVDEQYRDDLDNAEYLKRKTILDDWINDTNNDLANQTVVTNGGQFNWIVSGRIVKKPDGGFGIVPPVWTPPQ